MKVCIWPLCKWGLFLIVFAIKCLILSYFGIEEISIGGAPFGINLRSDIGLWGALSVGIVWCSDVFELVSHFCKFILMHLGAVEIICVFQFHLFQFLVILKDFLVFENLFILGLEQKANFAFVTILFNAFDLGLAHSFFDFRFGFTILLQLLNNAGYPVRKSIKIKVIKIQNYWQTYPILKCFGILYPAGLSIETSALEVLDQLPVRGVLDCWSFGTLPISPSMNLDAGNKS